MKRLKSLITSFAALAVGVTFIACEKTPDKPASNEPAKPAEAAKPAGTPKPADTAKPAEAPKPAPAATAADVAKIAGVYGFAAQLPKDVEAFSAYYRGHDVWAAIANSKWAATLLDIAPLKEDAGFARMREQWNSPEAQKGRELAESLLGTETLLVMPAGFTEKVQPLLEAYMKFGEVYLMQAFMAGMSGRTMGPAEIQEAMKSAAPTVIPMFAKCDVPPVLIIAKAVKSKADIDGAFQKLTSLVGNELPPAFELAKFTVADKHEFQSISVNAKKLIAAFQEEQIKLQLQEMLGDQAKAAEVLNSLTQKRAELAWGWVGDYLVVSFGPDHSHVKLAASEAESVLALGELSSVAAKFADKKLFALGYASRGMLEKMGGKLEFAAAFGKVAEELEGIVKPDAIAAMKADVKRLEGRAQSIFNSPVSTQVSVLHIDAGLRGEMFGGAKQTMIDSSKPLAFASLAGPTTFFLADGRSSAASAQTTELFEEAATMVWGWYEKYGRTMVPESERQGAAMIEATALPLLKQAWGASRALGKALGDESAFVIDLNGSVPKLPDLPPFLVDGKIPRIAYVAELKDRAALAESWKGFSSIIKQGLALAGDAAAIVQEPQSKMDGDVEINFIPLPVPTDDLLPHIAISKDRWIISTSPSFSKEIAAKPAGTGAPTGSHLNVNFGAAWNLGAHWLKIVDANATQMFGPDQAKQFQDARPLIDTALKLARSLEMMDARLYEESGQPRGSFHIKIEDVK